MGRGRSGLTFVEVLIIVVVVVLAVGLLVPIIMRLRAASERNQCCDNMRRLGFALHAYHDGYACFSHCLRHEPLHSRLSRQGEFRLAEVLDVELVGPNSPLSRTRQPLPANGYRRGRYAGGGPYALLSIRQQPLPWAWRPAAGFPLPCRFTLFSGRHDRRDCRAGCTSYLGVSGVTTMGSQLALAPQETPTDTRPLETDPQTGLQTGCNGVLVPRANTHNPPPGTRISDIKDGLGNTLMVGERPPSSDLSFGWMFAGYGNNGVGDLAVVLGISERAATVVESDSGLACRKAWRRRSQEPASLEIRARIAQQFLRCNALLESACRRRPLRPGRRLGPLPPLWSLPFSATRPSPLAPARIEENRSQESGARGQWGVGRQGHRSSSMRQLRYERGKK